MAETTKGNRRKSSIPISPGTRERKISHFTQTFCPNRHVFRRDSLLWIFSNDIICEAWNHADLCKTSICLTAAYINLGDFSPNAISFLHKFVLFHQWIPGKLGSFPNFNRICGDSFLVTFSSFFSHIDNLSIWELKTFPLTTVLPAKLCPPANTMQGLKKRALLEERRHRPLCFTYSKACKH